MNLRLVLRIVAILGLALVAALLLRGIFSSPSAEPKQAMAAIHVAAVRLPVGTLIRADDLAVREVPVAQVKKGEIAKDTPTGDKLSGAVVRRAMEEGAVITERDVVFPDAPGFLAAALKPGMRAVSVAIDDVTGNAGLTLPGDRVDLILTHELASTNPDAATAPPKVASETVLADVRVIAVGRTIRAPDGDVPSAPANSSSSARTVTLEVTPRDAESVAVVSRLGHLSLALRSLAQVREADSAAPSEPPSLPVWGKDISQVVRMNAEPVRVIHSGGGGGPAPVQVFRGGGGSK